MNFVVFPTKTLKATSQHANPIATSPLSYLCNTQRSPFLLPQKLQSALRRVVVFFWDDLQHVLRKLDMSVFILVIRVPIQESVSYLDCSLKYCGHDLELRWGFEETHLAE
jgi:hypothetical protein